MDVIAEDSTFIVSKNNKFGLIDFSGKTLLEFKYGHIFKNTKAICPTPFTYFGKFKDEKIYHVINLRNEAPVINNIINSYVQERETKRYGINFSAPVGHIDIKEDNFNYFKNKGFVDLNGWFQSTEDKKYSYINSDKGTIQLLNVSEFYSQIYLYNKPQYLKDYIALNKEIKNSNLIKIYKLKTTNHKNYENYNQLRDIAGIINTLGDWVVGPDTNFNYNIISGNLISKDSFLYKVEETQLIPLYSYYSIKYPFIKLTKNDRYKMIDTQGNIIKDSILNYSEYTLFPKYYFISMNIGQTHVIDNNANLIYDLKDYSFWSGFNLYGFATFFSSVDSTYLLVEGEFKKTIKCNKVIDKYYNFAFWDNFQGHLYYDKNKSPISLPLDFVNHIKSMAVDLEYKDLNENYFLLSLDNTIFIVSKSDKNYKYMMKDFRYHQTIKSYSDFFLFKGFDLKANKVLYYQFDFKKAKFELIP